LSVSQPYFDKNRRVADCRYVAYGTSLTVEISKLFWRRCGGAWVSLFRDYLHTQKTASATVINESRWGSDSRWGVANIASRVLRHKPNGVILEFAINDADIRNRISVDEARSNTVLMVDEILQSKADCKIWLMTSHVPSWYYAHRRPDLHHYYDAYRNLACQKGLGLVDLYARWGESPPSRQYMPDGIHPNLDAAQAVILPTVLAALNLE